MVLSSEAASELIRSRRARGPIEVAGRLDLTEFDGDHLPGGLRCYELDASGSQLMGAFASPW